MGLRKGFDFDVLSRLSAASCQQSWANAQCCRLVYIATALPARSVATFICRRLISTATFPLCPRQPHPPESMDLVIRRSAHRKLKPHTSSSQLPVHLPISIQPVIHPTFLLLIENNLQYLTSIFLRPNPLSHDLNRVHHISEYRIMHRRQSTRAGSLLSLGGTAAVGAFWTGEDAAGGEDQDVAV
jgi:hypothetical protein